MPKAQPQAEPSPEASRPPSQPKAAALLDRPAPAAPAAAAEAAADAPSKMVSEAGEAAGEASAVTATPVEGKETWCRNARLHGPFRDPKWIFALMVFCRAFGDYPKWLLIQWKKLP